MNLSASNAAYLDAQRVVEDGLNENADGVLLARSKFVRLLAAGLFGTAMSLFLPSPARASCEPWPCWGFCECPSGCCTSTNTWRCTGNCSYAGDVGCPSDASCWVTCISANLYKCCDCERDSGGYCICTGWYGTCGGG